MAVVVLVNFVGANKNAAAAERLVQYRPTARRTSCRVVCCECGAASAVVEAVFVKRGKAGELEDL
jgi:hypothetical protein